MSKKYRNYRLITVAVLMLTTAGIATAVITAGIISPAMISPDLISPALISKSAIAQQLQRIPALPATLHEYANITLPPHFNNNNIANADNTPPNNPITNEGATLGSVLFYDTRLSANDTTSCSSCHLQDHAFSDPVALSVGFEGGLTGRNSMGLTNARYYENGHFFWDERADTLEEQALLPIQDSVEMGLTLAELETKLAGATYYPDLFDQAFGTPDITSDRVALALSQFVRSMVSYQSKYDEGVGQGFNNFTPQEDQGRRIFEGPAGGCGACHGTAIQITDRPFNNGLDATTTDEGAGNGRFKVPSLRNVELTAPYMHDGRFATLAEVVEHYNSGVQAHPNLANQLRVRGGGGGGGGGGVQPRRLNLSQQQKDALVAFMETLTDDAFITDARFADPFVNAPVATVQPTQVPPTQVPPAPPTERPTEIPTALPVPPANTATPTVIPTATPTAMPTRVEEAGEQETVDVQPGRQQEVRFGTTRNGSRLVLNLPANSLSQATTLTFIRLDEAPVVTDVQVTLPNSGPTSTRFAGTRFTLSALQGANALNALTFSIPVDFQVRYPPSADDLDDEAIRLFRFDQESERWETAACGTESVDAGDNLVNTEVCQLGEFALFEVTAAATEPTNPVSPIEASIFLPMISN